MLGDDEHQEDYWGPPLVTIQFAITFEQASNLNWKMTSTLWLKKLH